MASKDEKAAWSDLDYETHDWIPSQPGLMSRTQRKKHTGPYRAAQPARVATIPVSDLGVSAETLAMADEASNAIARFDATTGTTLLPFTSVLLRSESAASSQIENLTASAKNIALAEVEPSAARRNVLIIVANGRAMQAAIALAGELDEAAVMDMHRALLEQSKPEIVGQWRTVQVWIGGSDYGPHGALFVPPHPALVPAAMNDLFQFIERDDLPVLVHAALAHAQFETVHPFPDGNGRTGRALVHAMLTGKGLTRDVTVPISAGLLVNTEAYFAALTAYRSGDPDEIVRQFAEASFLGIRNGTQLLDALRELKDGWEATLGLRRQATAWRLIDHLFAHPVVSARHVTEHLHVTATTALSAIESLVNHEVLTLISAGKKGKGNRIWAASKVLAELDAFSKRAGRRA